MFSQNSGRCALNSTLVMSAKVRGEKLEISTVISNPNFYSKFRFFSESTSKPSGVLKKLFLKVQSIYRLNNFFIVAG